MTMHSTALDQLAEIMSGLDRVKRWITDHPEIEFTSLSVFNRKIAAQIGGGPDKGERFTEAARALMDGAPKGAVKKELTASLYSVVRDFDGFVLDVYTSRDAVCEARVVGTETIRVPDPDAPMVTIKRDVVEWECKPLLAIDAEAMPV